MTWTNVGDSVFLVGELVSVGLFMYGAWLSITAPKGLCTGPVMLTLGLCPGLLRAIISQASGSAPAHESRRKR